MFRTLRLCMRISDKKNFHASSCSLYFEETERSGYPVVYDKKPKIKKLSLLGQVKEGYHALKHECSLLGGEIRNVFRVHKTCHALNEDCIVWKFDGTEQSLNQWVVTCDSDYKQGFSTCRLDLSPHGTGLFHGTLKTQVPKDGKTTKAGYCNMTTVRKKKSFWRDDLYDWSEFNTLILKVRGDGRCYMLNILQRGNVDVLWYCAYHYMLYTRGGPYWQYVKIPFSKFVFGARGVIQDTQVPIPEHLVTNFGITLGDQINGPFRLEIDYIGVCFDMNHFETFAYEMTDMSKT